MYANSGSTHSFYRIARLLLALVVFALFLALILGVQTAFASSRRGCSEMHTVKSGESLAKIAQKYRVHWQAIAEANGLKDPYIVFVGDRLCIPERSRDAEYEGGKAPVSEAASLSITLVGKDVKITTYNFPKKHAYNVKVDDAGDNYLRWSKLGILSLPKDGNATKSFELPRKLQTKQKLTVCLKDRVTDALICRTVLR